MGRHPHFNRRYNIKHLWDVNFEILRCIAFGMKAKEIAVILKVTPQTVSNTINSPAGQVRLLELRKERDASATDISRRIDTLLPKAVEVLENDLDEGTPEIRNRTARDLLDRAGINKSKDINVRHLHAHLSKEDITELREAALRANGIEKAEIVQDKDNGE